MFFEEVKESRKERNMCLTMLALSSVLRYPIISAFLKDLKMYVKDHRHRCKELRKVIKKVARESVNIEYCEIEVN